MRVSMGPYALIGESGGLAAHSVIAYLRYRYTYRAGGGVCVWRRRGGGQGAGVCNGGQRLEINVTLAQCPCKLKI